VDLGVPSQVEEEEPNDDSKSAQTVRGSAEVNAKFALMPARSDVDWYKIDASSGKKSVRVELTGVAQLNPFIEVYDQDRNKLFRVDAGGDGEGEVIPNLVCTGACYLKLEHAQKGGFAGEYKLTLTVGEPRNDEEAEPNNRSVDATALAAGTPIKGYIAYPEDEDWYLLSFPEGRANPIVRLEVSGVPDLKTELMVADFEQQAPLATYTVSEPGDAIGIRNLGQPFAAKLYLVVRSGWAVKNKRTFNAKQPYSISTSVEDAPPALEREPDDDSKRALAIESSETPRQAYLAPKGDVDFFVVKLNTPSFVRAEVTGVDRVDLELAAMDPAKLNEEKDNELAVVNEGGVKEPEVIPSIFLQPGEQYFRVRGALKNIDGKWVRDFENPQQTYTFSYEASAEDSGYEKEPNNDSDHATELGMPGKGRGFLWPKKDVDFWKVTIPDGDPQVVTLDVSSVPKVDLAVFVHDGQVADKEGNYQVIASSDRGKVEAEEKVAQLTLNPGTYYVEVRAAKGSDGNSAQDYVIEIR
jgi:hypothetical protein